MQDDASTGAGRALKVVQAGNILYTHIVDGEILGRHGVAPDPVDPRTGGGGARFAQVVDFGFGYRPISAGYPTATVGAYTVRQGDTLQGIAQANRLAGERDIRDRGGGRGGRRLRGRGGGYGAAGAAAAAIGGAAGSITGQSVGIAIGAQREFSWEPVAASAVGSAASDAVGASAASPGGSVLNNLALRAAAANAATQAIGVGAGLQDRFSRSGVAASAAGTMHGQQLGAAANERVGPVVGDNDTPVILIDAVQRHVPSHRGATCPS